MPGGSLTILVLAVGGNVSQGILKALARSKRPGRVIGADISAMQMGLYTVDLALISPWAREPAFIPWLIDVCRRESVDIILSGAEPVLMELARHREHIAAESGATCLVSDFSIMEICDDKWQTCQWLAAGGFNGAPFAAADDPEAVNTLVRDAGFPLVAKPRRGGGARGHFHVEDRHDLAYVQRKPGYLLQAHIGAPEDEYTAGCFMDGNGALAPSCVMRRELLAGTTYRATLGDFPEVRAEAERIAAALKPRGPCNVQLRMTEGGPVCFEINPRFSGTTPIRAHFGYNEVDAAIGHFLLGEPVRLPVVTHGVALRYWNELYVDPTVVRHLQAGGAVKDPAQFPTRIETYGHRDLSSGPS